MTIIAQTKQSIIDGAFANIVAGGVIQSLISDTSNPANVTAMTKISVDIAMVGGDYDYLTTPGLLIVSQKTGVLISASAQATALVLHNGTDIFRITPISQMVVAGEYIIVPEYQINWSEV